MNARPPTRWPGVSNCLPCQVVCVSFMWRHVMFVRIMAFRDGEELAHACGQPDFLRLAGREEPTIEGAEHWVAASADECGHEQRRADRRANAPDQPLLLQRATVAGQGGDTDQGRDLLAGQRTELRQLGR